MARVVLNGPPDPGDGRWCPVCLMDAKQKQWEMNQDKISDGYAADAATMVVVIPWPDALTREVQRGFYRAVCGDLPMLGIVDGLCWNHVAGINPTNAEVPTQLDTRTKIPPGLLRGKR
jgi:hypothetical protein